MNKKFYVTTPIYYPNDKLHIGHAYTTTLADYINRYKKMQGFETMFLTGSDEHGQKIEDKAKENNLDPLTFVTSIIEGFKNLWTQLGVEYDIFIRTTDKKHEEYVNKSFTEFFNQGFIYKSEYVGLYCKSDEAYYTDSQLVDGKCPDCGRELEKLSEESYFLEITKFRDWIKERLENSNILLPKHRVTELVNNFVNELQDLSITRTSFDWGIKINEDDKHVIYVWLDALQNYISALTYDESKFTVDEVWKEDSDVELLQLVGKEITRFHCIYWPIILKMKGYREPRVLAHGWLVADDGGKMSKSKGNVVDPIQLLSTYGKDAVRFYLTNNIVTGEDGKFSVELLEETINGLLVNKYSNLVQRTDAMVKKYFDGVVPSRSFETGDYKELETKLKDIKNDYFSKMDEYKFSDSTKELIKYVETLNGFIDITEPWKKEGEELSSILNILINEIHNISLMLSSILVDSYSKIEEWLSIEGEASFKNLDRDFAGTKLNNLSYLFERISK